MPDAIVLLAPPALLAIVLLFRFVGCTLDLSGLLTNATGRDYPILSLATRPEAPGVRSPAEAVRRSPLRIAAGWPALYGPEVEFGQKTYLAVTYDGTLRLHVNGTAPPDNPPPITTGYSPNPGKPLYIGMGHPNACRRKRRRSPLEAGCRKPLSTTLPSVRTGWTTVSSRVIAGP